MTDEKSFAFKKGHDTVIDMPPKKAENEKKESSLAADPETLHTTDPQEEMEGPISSIMQTIKEGGEASDVISKEEADRKKDENI